MNKPIPIIIICGQTATGKGDLAVALAKKINGEVVSADSRQVYKGVDLVSGKITQQEMSGIEHYVLDTCSLSANYSVDRYKREAKRAISRICKKGKVPIVCGGTGFYIEQLLSNNNLPAVEVNPTLRAKLQKKSLETLLSMLEKKDSDRFRTIDKNNKIRVIRALEICAVLGKVPVLESTKKNNNSSSLFSPLYIGLFGERDFLFNRIRKRLQKRIRMGMIDEVKRLLDSKKVTHKKLHSLGLECVWISKYLKDEVAKKEMVERLSFDILHYAKRQMTWFKRNKSIHWISCEKSPRAQRLESLNLIKNFLKSE